MINYEGILLCDKPIGMTSHKIVDILRKITGRKKIGHTGTLDPQATGLLVMCLGRATKITQFLIDADKTYEAEIKLGIRSSTFDSEGITDDILSVPIPDITEEQAGNILKEFEGKIVQKVPMFSAVKVGGRRMYKLARQGRQIEPPERDIDIYKIELVKLEKPFLRFSVSCSKGTYIRSLANDIGERIGCGGYLSGLRRIQVGDYSVMDAHSLNEIEYYQKTGALEEHIIPIETALQFPYIKVNEKFSPNIINGQLPMLKDIVKICGSFIVNDLVALHDYTGRIRAVGRAEMSSSELNDNTKEEFFKYVRVLN